MILLDPHNKMVEFLLRIQTHYDLEHCIFSLFYGIEDGAA